MNDFSGIESLSQKELLELYDDIIENKSYDLFAGAIWKVTCFDGRRVVVSEASITCNIGDRYYYHKGYAEITACKGYANYTDCVGVFDSRTHGAIWEVTCYDGTVVTVAQTNMSCSLGTRYFDNTGYAEKISCSTGRSRYTNCVGSF